MPHRHHVTGRKRVKRYRSSTLFWIVFGIVMVLFVVGLYVSANVSTGNLEPTPMPELGF
jgi:hypothetical protein